jgi:hypothetical protein
MKKTIIGLSSVVLLSLAVLLFINARVSPCETEKLATEICAPNSSCTQSATCVMDEKAACDPAKCEQIGCDKTTCQAGKCDPSTCTVAIAATTALKGCAETCSAK